MLENNSEYFIELLQKKAKIRFSIVFVSTAIALIIMLILGAFIEINKSSDNVFFSVISVITASVMLTCGVFFILYFLVVKKAYERFNTEFKNTYVLSTIQQEKDFSNLSYNMKYGFGYNTVHNSGVVNAADSDYFLSEDMLTGRYKNTNFQYSDVTTRRRVIRNKRIRIENVFDGQIMRFEMFDSIKVSDEYLQVFEKEFWSKIEGWTAENKVQTDNELFNSKFKIFATNEHNAFYILTPQLMEKILDFSKSIDSQIAVAFYGTVMFVAINRNISIFDGKIDKPIIEQKQDILNDINMLKTAGDILLCKYYEEDRSTEATSPVYKQRIEH